jgi:LPS sulfotransferase NodH
MKLPQPFIRLPLSFDAERLAAEVAALPASAWARHPNAFEGNSAARLISVDGGENDDVSGVMQATPHLQASPYIQQVLASFGVVWSRSRLMKLAPGAKVPEHSDINYHWFQRVRIHIPVTTRPGVRFYCDDQAVHMRAGEAWIFDNWRQHRVDNATDQERVHLVADTSGSAMFWNLVAAGMRGQAAQLIPYRPGQNVSIPMERFNRFRVMPPAEMDHLLKDLAADLVSETPGEAGRVSVAQFTSLLNSFCADWRQLWALHGDSDSGIEHYQQLSKALWQRAGEIRAGLVMRSIGLPAMRVLDARVLEYAIDDKSAGFQLNSPQPANAPAPVARVRSARFDRPVFIVAAPRSGSTLLFETLACSPQFATVGGEAHWLVEGFDHLSPGAPGIDSNQVGAEYATPDVVEQMRQLLTERVQDPQARRIDASVIRLLEKTPKNSLRIPFFDRAFPDAQFIYLWRDPRDNISSIIEAWRSGNWVTYPKMPDWEGSWSLLLPPGWRALRGRALEEIAAFQWESANRIVMDDLSNIDASRRMVVNYEAFVRDPAAEVKKICAFTGLQFDAALRDRVASALPPSRYTQTAPAAGKWRNNETLINRVLPAVQPLIPRIKQFG